MAQQFDEMNEQVAGQSGLSPRLHEWPSLKGSIFGLVRRLQLSQSNALSIAAL